MQTAVFSGWARKRTLGRNTFRYLKMIPSKNDVVVVLAQLWSNLLVQFGAIRHNSAIRQRNLNP